MRSIVHEFDGEMLTVRQIQARVPRLCLNEIRKHLAAGRNTKTAMLSYDPARVLVTNARKVAIQVAKTQSLGPKFGRNIRL